jgi:transcriptional regulator with XRE-family HTH domain
LVAHEPGSAGDADARPAASDAMGIVARNVARFRLQRQLSVSQLARQARVSKATLLAIELGQANPTLDTLEAIADSLSVPLVELMTQQRRASAEVQRGQFSPWHAQGELLIRRLGTLYGSEVVYVFLARINEKGYYSEGHEQGSTETLYVLSGGLEAGYADELVELAVGDYIRFPADQPHAYRSLKGVSEAFVVMARRQIPGE